MKLFFRAISSWKTESRGKDEDRFKLISLRLIARMWKETII